MESVVQANYLHMTAQTEQINNTRDISLFFLYHVTCVGRQQGTKCHVHYRIFILGK